MYFDRLLDFVYVEFMKGLQKGVVPKRCANCGRWFLQKPGATYAYCTDPAPGQDGKTCLEIGASSSFRSKVENNDVWKVHQRAYKKYFARIRSGRPRASSRRGPVRQRTCGMPRWNDMRGQKTRKIGSASRRRSLRL